MQGALLILYPYVSTIVSDYLCVQADGQEKFWHSRETDLDTGPRVDVDEKSESEYVSSLDEGLSEANKPLWQCLARNF